MYRLRKSRLFDLALLGDCETTRCNQAFFSAFTPQNVYTDMSVCTAMLVV